MHANALELFLHAPDRPEKIHCRGPRLPDNFADLIKVAFQITRRLGFRVLHAERDAHGCRDADRRRAAHHHVADYVRDLLVRLAHDVDFFGRQLRLIEEAHALVGPFESLNHEFVVSPEKENRWRSITPYAPRSGFADYSLPPAARIPRTPQRRRRSSVPCHRFAGYAPRVHRWR